MINARLEILEKLKTELLKIKTENGYNNNVYSVNYGFENNNITIPDNQMICNLHSRDEVLELESESRFNYDSMFYIAFDFQFQNKEPDSSIVLIAESIREDFINFLNGELSECLELDSIDNYEYCELSNYAPAYNYENNFCIALFIVKFFIKI